MFKILSRILIATSFLAVSLVPSVGLERGKMANEWTVSDIAPTPKKPDIIVSTKPEVKKVTAPKKKLIKKSIKGSSAGKVNVQDNN